MPQRSAPSRLALPERRQVGFRPRRSSPALARLHRRRSLVLVRHPRRKASHHHSNLARLCQGNLALAGRRRSQGLARRHRRRRVSHHHSNLVRPCQGSPALALHRHHRRVSHHHSSLARLCQGNLALAGRRRRALRERLRAFPARRHSPATARPLQGSAAQASPALARPLQATPAAQGCRPGRKAG